MQAMLLMNEAGLSRIDCPLRAGGCTFSAADTGICNEKALCPYYTTPNPVCLTENRIDAKAEILNFHIRHRKHDADTPCITGINIGKVGLLLENKVNTCFQISCLVCAIVRGAIIRY